MRELRRNLKANERTQVPFAIAVAITRTVNEARDQIRADLPQKFTTRNRWTEKGVRSLKATKRHLAGYVYSRDEYMVKQELGGTVKPQPGRKLALPRGVRKTKAQKIPRGKFPAAMQAKPRAYVAPLGKRGKGAQGIYLRKGRGKSAKGVLQYALDPRPYTVKARWGFEDTVEQVARRRLHKHFKRALDQAIATAKR